MDFLTSLDSPVLGSTEHDYFHDKHYKIGSVDNWLDDFAPPNNDVFIESTLTDLDLDGDSTRNVVSAEETFPQRETGPPDVSPMNAASIGDQQQSLVHNPHSALLRGSTAAPLVELPQEPSLGLHNNDTVGPSDVSCNTKQWLRQKRRQIPANAWEKHRAAIEQYLDQGVTYKGIVELLRTEHVFQTSESVLKRHLADWNLQKNLPHPVALFMFEVEKRRRAEDGKDTKFRFKGRPVADHRYRDAVKRAPSASIQPLPRDYALSNVSIITPPGSRPKHREQAYHLSDVDIRSHVDSDHTPGRLVIHQKEINDHTSTFASPLLEDRMMVHAYEGSNIMAELEDLPLFELHAKLKQYSSSEGSGIRMQILESIMPKIHEPYRSTTCGSITESERRFLLIEYGQTLTALHRFWRARNFLSSLPNILDWSSEETVSIAKLRLLSHLGQHLHEPIYPEQIERLGVELVDLECGRNETRSCPSTANLTLAYLLRLSGISSLTLTQPSLDKIEGHINEQCSRSVQEIPLSCIWLVQQFAQWHLAFGSSEQACAMLGRIVTITQGRSVDSATSAQSHKLQKLCQTLNRNVRPDSGQVVSIYEKSDVDSVWLVEFERYLWDKPVLERVRRLKEGDDCHA